ncbi:MAG: hypothetical protein IT365_13695 [Candidatus Hydrogenedentes bacterium]|nr:hypothetical protein [Candidatus Hydrogenedentota bacterium]
MICAEGAGRLREQWDCGNKRHHVCLLDGKGEVIGRTVVRNRAQDVQEALDEYQGSLLALVAD